MSLPATDSFTTDSNQALTTYSANWTINAGAFTVRADLDAVYGSGSGEEAAHWNADTFADDQYAITTIKISGGYMGPAVRVHASAHTIYGLYGDSSTSYLHKVVDGTYTDLASGAGFGDGSVIKLEVEGTTLRSYQNGSASGMPTDTDESIGSGYAGIVAFDTNINCALYDWEGGNLGGEAPVLIAEQQGGKIHLAWTG